MFMVITVYIAVCAVTLIGVGWFRRWSLKREIIDVPNERSSHTVPTPRGGGLVIFAVSVLTLLIYSMIHGENFYWAYILGAGLVAAVSLLDDIREISPFKRIVCHGLAAGVSVWVYGGFEWLWIPFYGIVHLGFLGSVIAFLWIVWLINAYNFMDGIDGIAATQSITAGIGWGLAGFFYSFDDIGFYAGVLASSSIGFIFLNWQPARIFMGDVGSAFLGFSFAVLPLLALKRMSDPTLASIVPWIGVFLVWFFVFDSFYTLIGRLFRGAKIWQPHREHIYQKLVIGGLSHALVTTIYGTASLILVLVLTAAMRSSWGFEKTVLATALGLTGLLLLTRRLFLYIQRRPLK